MRYLLFLLIFWGEYTWGSFKNVQQFLKKHCYECHDADIQKGDIRFDNIQLENPENYDKFQKIYYSIHNEQMPPKKKILKSEVDRFLSLIKRFLYIESKKKITQHGRTTWRRLTRTEYQNTIRELLALPELNLLPYIPADEKAHGFSKDTSVLDMSLVHFKSYMEAAEIALKRAYEPSQQPDKAQKQMAFEIPKIEKNTFTCEKENGNYIFKIPNKENINSRPVKLTEKIKYSGKYKVSFKGKLNRGNNNQILKVFGLHFEKPITIKKRLSYFEATSKDWKTHEFEVNLHRGEEIFFHLPEKYLANKPLHITLKDITIEGPLFDVWPPAGHTLLWGNLKSHRVRVHRNHFRHEITPPKLDIEIVTSLLRNFLTKAFRRQVTNDEVNTFRKLYQSQIDNGAHFQNAMMSAYKAALISPHFLYKKENPGKLRPLELAERLAYFLWNSPPDQTLLDKANMNKLIFKHELVKEVDRLFEDRKSRLFIEDFSNQWLNLESINETNPDPKLYPESSGILTDSMHWETIHFLSYLIKNNLPILNIIDSNFGILNSRLARHYGIKNIEGMFFRKVLLPKALKRGGLITHGSILKLTANGTFTSPIHRGVWFQEKIMGRHLPPPPNSVPSFDPKESNKNTLREKLAEHRSNSACSICHKLIDPYGFAFEEYDPIGNFRTHYRKTNQNSYKYGDRVESSDTFKNGQRFGNMEAFKRLILQDKQDVVINFINKLITYATGTPPDFADQKEIYEIYKNAQRTGFKAKSIIKLIVISDIFRRK